MEYKVLEFKHHAPYDGCHWQWEYVLVGTTHNNHGTFVHQVWNIAHYEPRYGPKMDQVMVQKVVNDPEDSSIPWNYDTFLLFPLDDNLWDEVPTNYIPTFVKFFNGSWVDGTEPVVKDLDYSFKWKCGYGGELTDDYPFLDTGYRGNGGVGVEYDGWVCDEHEGEYCWEQSTMWTEEVLRMEFQEWLPDDTDLGKLAGEVLQVMEEKFNFSCMEDGGNYPRDEEVRQALEFMGYMEPVDGEESQEIEERVSTQDQIDVGQLQFPGLEQA